jgi:hypothetical protein
MIHPESQLYPVWLLLDCSWAQAIMWDNVSSFVCFGSIVDDFWLLIVVLDEDIEPRVSANNRVGCRERQLPDWTT